MDIYANLCKEIVESEENLSVPFGQDPKNQPSLKKIIIREIQETYSNNKKLRNIDEEISNILYNKESIEKSVDHNSKSILDIVENIHQVSGNQKLFLVTISFFLPPYMFQFI